MRLTWYLDGVMVGVLLLLGIYHLLPISESRRNKLTLWTVLLFYIYFLVLILSMLGIVIWEAYSATT